MRKPLTHIRVYKDDKIKLSSLANELSYTQGKRVSIAETIRRNLNIPILKPVLKEDAFFKRRFRR